MLSRLLRASLPAILAGTFGPQLAHADIYTWVDASGAINVSNLAPPDGVRVTNILRASAPATATRDDAARNAARQAEVQEEALGLAQSQAITDEQKNPLRQKLRDPIFGTANRRVLFLEWQERREISLEFNASMQLKHQQGASGRDDQSPGERNDLHDQLAGLMFLLFRRRASSALSATPPNLISTARAIF